HRTVWWVVVRSSHSKWNEVLGVRSATKSSHYLRRGGATRSSLGETRAGENPWLVATMWLARAVLKAARHEATSATASSPSVSWVRDAARRARMLGSRAFR